MSKQKVSKEDLIRLYVNDEQASMQDVANVLGCNRSTVFKAMKRYGLPSKSSGPIAKQPAPELDDRTWLARELETKTMRQIAQELGTTSGRVSDRAYRYGIQSPSADKSRAVRAALKKRYPHGRVGKEASKWKGGRRINNGYIFVYAPDHPSASNKAVAEHRLVMEKGIGRYLKPNEVVHHLDGNRQNNDLSNLVLKTRAQHVSDHFKASHEVLNLRKRVKDLEATIDNLRKELAEC